MDKVKAFLYTMLGASWFTSLMGYIIMAGGAAQLVQDGLAHDGIPKDTAGWITLATGIAVKATKQANVSNATKPLAVAVPVVAESGAVLAKDPVVVAKP